MKVIELLNRKYAERMKNISSKGWQSVKEQAEVKKLHPAEVIYLSLEITEYDIKANGGYSGELWEEIKRLHQSKLMASNQHRQYHGKVDAYWLTAKGMRRFRSQIL